jgi:hypothetical protein
MAKPLLFIAFHAGEPFGATLESARLASAETVVRGAGEFPARATRSATFAAIAKAANALGVACLVAATDDRLVACLGDPQERKALFDAISRSRLVPTPIGGTGAELNLLSPVEVADELRLNFDIWRRAMFTAPIARAPRVETRFATRTANPAAEIGAANLPIKGETLIVVDVDTIARDGDLDAALMLFVAAVKARKDWTLSAAAGQPSAQYERMLRDILVAGARAEVIPGATTEYDPARHGFPLELARALASPMVASRTLAGSTDALSLRPLDFAALEPKIARGLLLRRLTGAFGGATSFPFTERLRASFTLGLALLDRLGAERAEEPVTAAEITLAADIVTNLERAIETVQRTVTGDDAIAHLGDAKKAKTRVVRSLPKVEEGGPLPKRGDYVAALRKACPAAVQSLGHLGDALRCPRAKASPATQLRESVV